MWIVGVVQVVALRRGDVQQRLSDLDHGIIPKNLDAF